MTYCFENTFTRIVLVFIAVLTIGITAAAYSVKAEQTPLLEKRQMGISTDYAKTLFDSSYVHTIDISVSDTNWNYLKSHAMKEAWVLCDVTVDGEPFENVAIRPKGNSSLESIDMQGSDRFSFKIEFDHFTAGKTCHGLDKLVLNNLGQDYSCMKDFLTYTMMADMGVATPLCSYTQVTKNGEPFGLYLAVEAVEDSFVNRAFGTYDGNIYQPDVYDIRMVHPKNFMNKGIYVFETDMKSLTPGDRLDTLGPIINTAFSALKDKVYISASGYAGDDPNNYSMIFDSSTFSLNTADKNRYIGAVKNLNTGAHPEQTVDLNQLIPYFVIHNFVNNYDSFTGCFVHNFYLYEQNGKLSYIPWDYNLGYGAFSMESALWCFLGDTPYYIQPDLGLSMSSDKSFVNYPVDDPFISARPEDRPLLNVILKDDEIRERYHQEFSRFISRWFDYDDRFNQVFESTREMIQPSIASGLTFYTEKEFLEATEELKSYCQLRSRSIRGQLEGSIPTTLAGQKEQYETLIDTGSLNLGKTIDFGGLAWGVTREDVCRIAGIVTQDPKPATKDMILQILRNTPVFTVIFRKKVLPHIYLIVTIIALWIAVKVIRAKGGR